MKEKSFVRFLILCLFIGIVCLVAAFIVQKVFVPFKSFRGVYILIPFVTLITIVVHFVLIKASSNPKTFVGKFVAFSGLKLMIYLITILIYAFAVRNEVIIFMLSFLITYFLFTILEISAILKFLKK